MVLNKKVTGTAKSVPVGIAIGTVVALVITLVGSLITAWLIRNEKISEETIGYCSMAILMIASMAGSFAAQAMVKHQRLIMCSAVGVAYYLSLIAITAMFFGGQYHGMGVTALVIAAGATMIILIGLKESKRHNSKLKKYGYG